MRVTDIAVNTVVRQTSNIPSPSIPSNWMYKPREELEWGTRTAQTDVYSFAATIYSVGLYLVHDKQISLIDLLDQLYTLEPPFPYVAHSYGKRLMQIVDRGHNGIFGAAKPAGMGDGLWEIIQKCWAMDPSARPSMAEVCHMMTRLQESSW